MTSIWVISSYESHLQRVFTSLVLQRSFWYCLNWHSVLFCSLLEANPGVCTYAVQYTFIDKAPAVCFTLLNSLSAVLLHLLPESASGCGVLVLQPHAVLSRVHLCRPLQCPVSQDQTYSQSEVMQCITLLHPSKPFCFVCGCLPRLFAKGIFRQMWCRSREIFLC